MSKLIALETKVSITNSNKVYVRAGEEVIFIKVYDEEFTLVEVASTKEKILIHSNKIGEANDTEVLVVAEAIKPKTVAPTKKTKSQMKGLGTQTELF